MGAGTTDDAVVAPAVARRDSDWTALIVTGGDQHPGPAVDPDLYPALSATNDPMRPGPKALEPAHGVGRASRPFDDACARGNWSPTLTRGAEIVEKVLLGMVSVLGWHRLFAPMLIALGITSGLGANIWAVCTA